MVKPTKKKTPINHDNENYHCLLLVFPVVYHWYITNPNTWVYWNSFKQIISNLYELLPLIITVSFILLLIGFFLER